MTTIYRCGTKALWDGQTMPVLERIEALASPQGAHTLPGDTSGTRYTIISIADAMTPMVMIPPVFDQFGQVAVPGSASIPDDYWNAPLKAEYTHVPSSDWYPLYAAYREEIDLSMPEMLPPTGPTPGVVVIEPAVED
jgi:hypothetical protein